MPCGFTAAQSIIARLFFEDYVRLCELRTMRPVPAGSLILTSDDVFDYMLDLRAMNDGIDSRREQLFSDYNDLRREKIPDARHEGLRPAQAGKRRAAIQPVPDGAPHIACQCAHPLQTGRAHWLCSASASVRMHCICWMSLKTAFRPNGSWSWHNFCMILRGFTTANLL